MVNALISSWVDHVTLAADEADVDHVLRRNSEVSRRHAVAEIGKLLKEDEED